MASSSKVCVIGAGGMGIAVLSLSVKTILLGCGRLSRRGGFNK